MKKLKLNFKDNDEKTVENVVIAGARFHLLQEMRVGLREDGTPFYVMKFELVTDIDSMMSILNNLQSDGSIVAQVTDGKGQEGNNDDSRK